MDDLTPEFVKTLSCKEDLPHPKMIELAKVIARISAKEDYTEHLSKFSKNKDGPK